MSRTVRTWFFGIAAVILAAFLVAGLHGLPSFGHYRGPYGDIINASADKERQATDAVTAVNLDYRGVDTIGEEFILFTSAIAVTLLLRPQAEESQSSPEEHEVSRLAPITTRAIRLVGLLLAGPTLLLGLDIVSHGQITPGGGFQGGIILATAMLLIFLAGSYRALRKLLPQAVLDAMDGIGAGGFVAIGFIGMIAGVVFLQNVLPLGESGSIDSAGTMLVIYLFVGLEVGAALVLISIEFLHQLLEVRSPQASLDW